MTDESRYYIWTESTLSHPCLKCCRECGLLVGDTVIHDKWHENYTRVAEGAHYGSMLRPLK